MYSKNVDTASVDEARKLIFAHNQNMEKIPPTRDALLQHIRRAIYQTDNFNILKFRTGFSFMQSIKIWLFLIIINFIPKVFGCCHLQNQIYHHPQILAGNMKMESGYPIGLLSQRLLSAHVSWLNAPAQGSASLAHVGKSTWIAHYSAYVDVQKMTRNSQ